MSHPTGNCLQAAVASVLDLPLHGVPDFSGEDGMSKEWLEDMVKWAKERDLGVVVFDTNQEPLPALHNVWVVAVGHTQRNGRLLEDDTHAIVAKADTADGNLALTMEHDPHPSQAFIEAVKFVIFFTKQ
jgi:hypothetical protein